MAHEGGDPGPAAAAGPAELRYGDRRDQVAELWPGERRLVVLLHGGFWRQEFDRTHLRPLAAAVAGTGVGVLLPEYARTGGGGGWPATFDDVAAALGLLAGAAADEDHEVVLCGHSAGGQLALWAAAAGACPRLARVVALAPVADLREAHRLGLDDGAVRDLLGGGPDEVPGRYESVDPVSLPEPSCPVRLLHDPADDVVPVELSRRYVDAHPDAVLVDCPGGHFGLIDPTSTAWPLVREALTD